ncbi:MAG: glutaredoxin [Pseudomonadota bacterium]
MSDKIKVQVYRWAGQFGPFKVKIPCGDCTLTKDIIKDTLETELAEIPTEVETKDWLSHWWEPLFKGGIHAPIVLVGGKIVSQGAALNRGLLTQAIIEEYIKTSSIQGNVVFGKETCPYCKKAKKMLDEQGISYQYFDVVKEPRALYEMIPRVKEIIGLKTPVTVPQIWMDGRYVGGADQLSEFLSSQEQRRSS